MAAAELAAGDCAYLPRGCGHSVHNIGGEPCEVVGALDSGEYQEISLANWLGGNPVSLLMDNFSVPRDVIDRFPKRETGIFGRKA